MEIQVLWTGNNVYLSEYSMKKLFLNFQTKQQHQTSVPRPLPEGSYCCIHDSCAVCSNWISNMPNINSVQMFVITCSFNKNL